MYSVVQVDEGFSVDVHILVGQRGLGLQDGFAGFTNAAWWRHELLKLGLPKTPNPTLNPEINPKPRI